MSLLDNLPHKCRIQHRVKANDAILGGGFTRVVDQENVECWEQALSATDSKLFEKESGITCNKKIFFLTDPQVTAAHEIVITERLGVAVPEANERVISKLNPWSPDASAGLGLLFRVVGNDLVDSTT
jgi:hypothetical protein